MEETFVIKGSIAFLKGIIKKMEFYLILLYCIPISDSSFSATFFENEVSSIWTRFLFTIYLYFYTHFLHYLIFDWKILLMPILKHEVRI